MNSQCRRLLRTSFLAGFAAILPATHAIAGEGDGMPRLLQKDGRYALMVDGAPFVMLGGQTHNSSNYPKALDKVWPAIRDAHANTLEIPVAWEQIEPVEGSFDFSYVDTLVEQARQNKVHLVLLWFGTWKNTFPQYTPAWVKFDRKRFPRTVDKAGRQTYCLSPFGEETFKADRKAFVALMQHIRKIDEAQHTIIMMQVENEVGTFGVARDYSPMAEAAFRKNVPQAVLARQKAPVPKAATGTWSDVYGDYADEYFHAWAIASYIEEIAKAGRAAYNLPMYVNDALRDPLAPIAPWKNNFVAGGPNHDVIDIYKAAAPHIDIAAPDIYLPESNKVAATLDHFQRPNNALMVPEMANAASYARYVYQILGRGALAVSPFGIDYADYSNFPLGSKLKDKNMIEPFGKIFAAFRPMARQWATWAFEGKTWGVAEGDDRKPQTIVMKDWKATVSFREWQMGESSWNPKLKETPDNTESPNGGVAIAQIGDNEFIIVGQHARVKVEAAGPGTNMPSMWGRAEVLERVEEGQFDASGKWVMERVWNGDQVDFGLNLTGNPVVLKVTMGAY